MDRDALTYLADQLRSSTNGEIPDDERQEIEEQFYEIVRDDKFGELEDLVDRVERTHDVDLSEIRSFADMVNDTGLIEANEEEEIEAELSDGLAQAIKMQVKQKEDNEMIVRTDEKVKIGDLFRVQDQLYRDHGKKAFVISNQKQWDGRVSVELSGTKEKLQLLRVYESEEGLKFKHLGQSQTQYKGMKVKDEHTHGFFIYKFMSNDTEYLLFTTDKLDPMTCKVKGMHLKLSDFRQFGENTGMPVNRDIIFAHSVEPAIKSLDREEVERISEKVDHEWLATRLLGDWRHPEWFEKMNLCMHMVSEEHGFPSGMLMMAEPGTGKTKLLEAQTDAFDEKEGIHTGSASTIKGLTPSFADNPPDEGYLLKTTRISAIDEVFNLLSSARNGRGNIKDAFRPLLDLVEHQNRTFSSGNGSIKGKMDSLMIGAGNDSYGIGNMYEAAENLDEAFLSRFLLYEQTPQHIDWIENRKFDIDEQDAENPDGDPEFISMIDHLQSDVEVSVDRGKVRDIKKDLQPQVPSNFEAIYRSRYDHHIKNLVSGHSKYRSIVEGSLDFEAREEDYRFAYNIIEILVNSWVRKSNLEEMSIQARPYYLQKKKREVFEYIRDEYPVEKKEIEDKIGNECGFELKELRELDLIDDINGYFHPYFSEDVEIKDNKKFGYINNGEG